MTKWKSKTKEEKNEYRRNYRLAKKEGTGGYNTDYCQCRAGALCEQTKRAYDKLRKELSDEGFEI